MEDQTKLLVIPEALDMFEVWNELAHCLNWIHVHIDTVRNHLVLVRVRGIRFWKDWWRKNFVVYFGSLSSLLHIRGCLSALILIWRGVSLFYKAVLRFCDLFQFCFVKLDKGCHIFESLDEAFSEQLAETHLNLRKVFSEMLFELSVSCKVKLGECIFNIAQQWVICDHFWVVFDHHARLKLPLLSLLFVFVWFFGILVKIAITIAVNSNLEKLAIIVIGAWQGNGFFEHFERLTNRSICIKECSIDSDFEPCLTLLGSCECLFQSNKELLEIVKNFEWVSCLLLTFDICINNQIELWKFDSWV